MSAVDIIAASAGTGKTHRLSTVLEESVASEQARPDAIVATTFTLKAAAELRERLRTRLMSRGFHEAAQRLAGARVGTVNAICTQLITDFAFDLGLSPTLHVLDDAAAAHAIEASLSSSITSEVEVELEILANRLSVDWRSHCGQIVNLARTNHLAPAPLSDCATRSFNEFEALLPPIEDGDVLETALLSAIAEFETGLDPRIDDTKKTQT